MFGRSNAIGLDSYSARRARKRVPRWLLLLLLGVLLGAGGVIVAQERWLPPRLGAAESARLSTAYDNADRERLQLRQQLAETQARLQQATATAQKLDEAAKAQQRSVAALHESIDAMVEALPPDPRGGTVQVRAARFRVEGNQLAYDIVLSREKAGDKPFTGVLQMVLTGTAGSNDNANARLDPVPISMGRHTSLHGSRPLPASLAARQVTLQVLDKPQGQLLGMRVMNLR